MNRSTRLGTTLLTLFFFTAFSLFSLASDADAATTKKYRKSSSKKRTAGISKVVVLGKFNDISKVKRSLQAAECPAPSKIETVSSPRQKSPPAPVDNSRIGKLISARSAIILDGRSGRTLFAKNADNPRQPASTIKILTGMIAIKTLGGNEPVAVSRWAADQPRSKVDLNPQKQYQANDLINAVLLASANDASVALAEKIAGSEPSFARMMTEKAREWGAKNTVCKTASGLTATGQASTARDLAVMFRHFMQDPAFASRMKQVKVKTSYGTLLRNHNKALWQVEGTQGGKTGFTNAARQTYVGKFKRGDQEIVIAVMGCETMWADVKKLVQHGFSLQDRLAAAPASQITEQKMVARSTP